MRLLLITFLLTLNISAQTLHETLMKLSSQNLECLDAEKNVLECSQKYYKQLDSLLNVVYKNIQENLNETKKQDLQNRQQIWIKSRDIQFKKIDIQNKELVNNEDNLIVKTQAKCDFVFERVSFMIATYISKNKINFKDQILKFVPAGYRILDTVRGNLNNDVYDDYIMVLKKNNELELSKTANIKILKRPLLILVGNSENNLVLKGRNDNSVLCITCSGVIHKDSYENVIIKNGYFFIEHHTIGSNDKWSRIITFKYNSLKDSWFLDREAMEFFGRNRDKNGEAIIKTSETILTKKDFGTVLFENYNIYKK